MIIEFHFRFDPLKFTDLVVTKIDLQQNDICCIRSLNPNKSSSSAPHEKEGNAVSTGLYHWCPEQSLASCLLVSIANLSILFVFLELFYNNNN